MATAKKTAPKAPPVFAAPADKAELQAKLGAIGAQALHGDHRAAVAELAQLLAALAV